MPTLVQTVMEKRGLDITTAIALAASGVDLNALAEKQEEVQQEWTGVDIDGTLAYYTEFPGLDQIGAPIQKMVARVQRWLARGRAVKIFTARIDHEGEDLALAVKTIQDWCLAHIGQVLPITNKKDRFMVDHWDDRVTTVIPNSGDLPAGLHESGTSQINLPPVLATQFRDFAEKKVRAEDLATDGLEREPHITVLYGFLPEVRLTDVELAVSDFGPIKVTLGDLDVFTGALNDVLISKVASEGLVKLNALLRSTQRYETDHPDYLPHATLAYLRPGTGSVYAGPWELSGETFVVDKIEFCDRYGRAAQVLLVPPTSHPMGDFAPLANENPISVAVIKSPDPAMRGPCGSLCAECEKRDTCDTYKKLVDKCQPDAGDVHVVAPLGSETPKKKRADATKGVGLPEVLAKWADGQWPVTVLPQGVDSVKKTADCEQALLVSVRWAHLESPMSTAVLKRKDGKTEIFSNAIPLMGVVTKCGENSKGFVYQIGLWSEETNSIVDAGQTKATHTVVAKGERIFAEASEFSNGQLQLLKLRCPAMDGEPAKLTSLEDAAAMTQCRKALRSVVPPSSQHRALVGFVGASPGKVDAARGEPLVGPGGETFTHAYLEPLGLKREDVFITNIVPVLKSDVHGNVREPTSEELESWGKWALAEIEKQDPILVVALGQTAKAALGARADFVLPHPMAVRRFGDSGELKRKLKKIAKALEAAEILKSHSSNAGPQALVERAYFRMLTPSERKENLDLRSEEVGKTDDGEVWRISDGWGERYFAYSDGVVKHLATKMADVLAFHCIPELDNVINKATIKSMGWGNKAWDQAILGWAQGPASDEPEEEELVKFVLTESPSDPSGSDPSTITIKKADSDRQIVYGVVLEPDTVDSQDDVISADEIEKAAHRFMEDSRVMGNQHSKRAKAIPVESFIAPGDFSLGGQTVRKGSWVLGVHVLDPVLWQAIKAGQYTGFSVGGVAVREPVR